MGIVLEFYRLSDEKIVELKNQSEKLCSEYLDDNYANVLGKEHKENDTVFSLDKSSWRKNPFSNDVDEKS